MFVERNNKIQLTATPKYSVSDLEQHRPGYNKRKRKAFVNRDEHNAMAILVSQVRMEVKQRSPRCWVRAKTMPEDPSSELYVSDGVYAATVFLRPIVLSADIPRIPAWVGFLLPSGRMSPRPSRWNGAFILVEPEIKPHPLKHK
jgi:hypothetical protein